jgi:hypothetical protein
MRAGGLMRLLLTINPYKNAERSHPNRNICYFLIGSTERDGGKPASEELQLNWNLLSDIGLLKKDPKSISFQILFLSLMEIQQSIGKLVE